MKILTRILPRSHALPAALLPALLGLALFGRALPAPAQENAPPADWWQLDVVVFEHARPAPYDYDESWGFAAADWPPMITLPAGQKSEPLPGRLQELPPETSTLTEAAGILDRRGEYRLLARQSLRFPKNTATPRVQLTNEQPLRLVARDTREPGGSVMDYWLSGPDLEPPVDIHRLEGWVQLAHDIHPIVQLSLSYLQPLSGIAPQQVDPDGRAEYFRDQVHQYWLEAQRRLRPGRIAYFDHPRIGVLARLTAVPDPEPPQPKP